MNSPALLPHNVEYSAERDPSPESIELHQRGSSRHDMVESSETLGVQRDAVSNENSTSTHALLGDTDGANRDEESKFSGFFETRAAADATSHVFWKGNPWYPLSWDLLGILISICFLSKLLYSVEMEVGVVAMI